MIQRYRNHSRDNFSMSDQSCTNNNFLQQEKERSRYTNFKSATRIDTYLLSAIAHICTEEARLIHGRLIGALGERISNNSKQTKTTDDVGDRLRCRRNPAR